MYRVAAISVAQRVAEEVGCVLGDEVSFEFPFLFLLLRVYLINDSPPGRLQCQVRISTIRKHQDLVPDRWNVVQRNLVRSFIVEVSCFSLD